MKTVELEKRLYEANRYTDSLNDSIGLYKELVEAQEELRRESFRLIGEIIDNYEADAINLPAEMYNDLKFHWKRLKQLINDK